MRDKFRVNVRGPLEQDAAGFAVELEHRGYTLSSLRDQLRLLAHVSRWLDERGLRPRDLSAKRVTQFLAARRRAGYTRLLSPRGLAPILEFLRANGRAPPEVPRRLGSFIGKLIAR